MSDEIVIRLPQGREPPQSRGSIENHDCEHPGCGKLGGFGFARPRRPSHWFCMEHRDDDEEYLSGGERQ